MASTRPRRTGRQRYGNLDGDSGIRFYIRQPSVGEFQVTFAPRNGRYGFVCSYTLEDIGRHRIARLRRLAKEGRGLNAYMNRLGKRGFTPTRDYAPPNRRRPGAPARRGVRVDTPTDSAIRSLIGRPVPTSVRRGRRTGILGSALTLAAAVALIQSLTENNEEEALANG